MLLSAALTLLCACADSDPFADMPAQPTGHDTNPQLAEATAILADGLYNTWQPGDSILLLQSKLQGWGTATQRGPATTLQLPEDHGLAADETVFGVFPHTAEAALSDSGMTVCLPHRQVVGTSTFDRNAAVCVGVMLADTLKLHSVGGGLRLRLSMSGVETIELESVDGYPLAGTALLHFDEKGTPVVVATARAQSIVTLNCQSDEGFAPGTDYYIATLPCNLYGGYRLSLYKDGLVAHYFGVHQTVERAGYITPPDWDESTLTFDDPDAPLVEEERPELDATTSALLRQYQKSPTEENKQALLEQMGIRYDKVVARKKAKLRELEREAKTPGLVEEMQAIVDEMVENRDIRLQQQFLRLIDPRTDENPKDNWLVLRGAAEQNAYIGYAPVTNAEYAAFNPRFTYEEGRENYPVVNLSVTDVMAYCAWLGSGDDSHDYRLPTDEEWVLAAGHMPKDVVMNSEGAETGLTAVDAYRQTTGACGGIDFWGNCWEWTGSTDPDGLYIVKGGSWDSPRDDCRSEKSDVTRSGLKGYPNVGFRVVRTDANHLTGIY